MGEQWEAEGNALVKLMVRFGVENWETGHAWIVYIIRSTDGFLAAARYIHEQAVGRGLTYDKGRAA